MHFENYVRDIEREVDDFLDFLRNYADYMTEEALDELRSDVDRFTEVARDHIEKFL